MELGSHPLAVATTVVAVVLIGVISGVLLVSSNKSKFLLHPRADLFPLASTPHRRDLFSALLDLAVVLALVAVLAVALAACDALAAGFDRVQVDFTTSAFTAIPPPRSKGVVYLLLVFFSSL